MQAERKELERNALAQHLGRALEGMKQGPSRGTVIFLAVVVAGVLAFLVFRYFYVSSSEASSHRWYELDSVQFPEQLATLLAEGDFKDTPQFRLAEFKEARVKLSQGLRDLGSPGLRGEAYRQMSEATEIYERLAKTAGRVPLLHQEALWGAAKGYESQGGPDNLEKARALYEKLRSEYPASALGKDARKQLDRLDSDATKQDLRELSREFAPPPSK